jgi:hypothetical protein
MTARVMIEAGDLGSVETAWWATAKAQSTYSEAWIRVSSR